VLYEMLTGQRLFEGETVSDTLIEVVSKEPDWERIPVVPGRNVRRLLRRCLEKDPKRRLRDIGDAWDLLEETAQATGLEDTKAQALRRWLWLASAVAALLFVTAATVSLIHFRETTARAELVRFQIPAPEAPGFASIPFLSPDGSTITFAGRGPAGRNIL